MQTKKTCLITGASKGLGEYLACRFWGAGYNLCLVARNKDKLGRIIQNLPERKNQKAIYFICDLANNDETLELAAKVKSSLPRLDVLINNAAIQGPIGASWENNVSIWQKTIQVNLLAPVALCRALIPRMKEAGGGSIINLSGGGAVKPRANFSAYATAKAGLIRFSETLAEETKSLGIRVNCIAPGAMKTDMLNEIVEKGAAKTGEKEYVAASKVFKEGGASMDKVADLALFLASDASNGITGKLISAVWDNWQEWPKHIDELYSSDVYTLRRIVGKDRGLKWGDK